MDATIEPVKNIKKGKKWWPFNISAALPVCMSIAFVLWLMVRLTNVYSGHVMAQVHYTNLPENKVLVKPLEKHLKLSVETSGFKLLLSHFGIGAVYVDIDYKELRNSKYILTEDLKKKFAETLPENMKLHAVSPDTLFMYFDEKSAKKVPIELKMEIDFEQQFALKEPIILSPESVTVTGPKVVLDSIKYWPTNVLRKKKVKSNLQGDIELVKPNRIGLSVSTDKTVYNLSVEEYTEQTLEIELHKINLPKGMQITTYPKKVKVTFQVAFSNYEAVNENGFEAVADFAKMDMTNNSEVDVDLIKYPPYLKNVTVSPESVEYIIYKQ